MRAFNSLAVHLDREQRRETKRRWRVEKKEVGAMAFIYE